MKKAFICVLLSLLLCFNLPLMAFAEVPTLPNVEGMSNDEAAALVNEYNAEVNAYNQQIDEDYNKAVQEYEEILAYNEEAAAHNAQEDVEVAKTNAANAAEQARVDAINQELQTTYEEELELYNSKTVSATRMAETSKYVEVTNGKETLYYDEEGNLLYKSIAGNTVKDDIITYENIGSNDKPIWSNTYKYNGINKRYVNFSIISTIGKTTTGTDWDNDASKYSNKVYSTIANLNNVTSLPLNYIDPGEGRNLINYLTKVDGVAIGLEQCDTIIRQLATIPLSNYFNSANGNEAAGAVESLISFVDFPSTQTIFNNLQANGSIFIDPDTGQKITGEDINAGNYTLRWFSVKYQSNGWRVSGVLLKNGVIIPPQEPEYQVANLIGYTPQYMILKQAIAPVKESYLEYFIFVPVTQETIENEKTMMVPEEIVVNNVQAPVQATVQNDRAILQQPNEEYYFTPIGESTNAGTRPTPSAESIIDNDTPLANLSSEKDSSSWALLNLIFMIISILSLLIIPQASKKEENKKQYRSNILGIILALAAILVFIFTQNIYLPMVIVDEWTLLMGAICIGSIINKIFSKKEVEN